MKLATIQSRLKAAVKYYPSNLWFRSMFCPFFFVGIIEDAAISAKSKILSSRLANLTVEDRLAGVDRVISLQAAFLRIFQMLLQAPEGSSVLYRWDEHARAEGSVSCPKMPEPAQLPVKLQELCATNGSVGFELIPNCTKPYEAYLQWCQPVVCHIVSHKSGYLTAMQIMAAIGGMYSIFTLFVFAILWRICRHIEEWISLPALRIPRTCPDFCMLFGGNRQTAVAAQMRPKTAAASSESGQQSRWQGSSGADSV